MTQHKENIIRLHLEGKSYSQIKEELGCSKGTISYHLGIGQKEKTRNRARKTINSIRKYIQEYKQSVCCADCKEDYPYWMLEFDHLSNKEFVISQFNNTTKNLERVKKEIEKCEVVCANCHKNRTYTRLITTGSSSIDLEDFYN
jgi:DNA-binding CsgD family transcriptional regulator